LQTFVCKRVPALLLRSLAGSDFAEAMSLRLRSA